MFILLCSPHSFFLIELLTTSLILISFFFSRIVTEKPHQGSVNKLLYYNKNYCIKNNFSSIPLPSNLNYDWSLRTFLPVCTPLKTHATPADTCQ